MTHGTPEQPDDASMDESSAQESYHGYSVDDETQPQGDGDALVDNRGLGEPLDEGYSPPEKWSAGQGFGTTPEEEHEGESLEQRLAQEVPEPDPYVEAAEAEVREQNESGGELGEDRAGRLVADDEGTHVDVEKDLVADDVGVDGAAATSEEAAVHVVEDDPA